MGWVGNGLRRLHQVMKCVCVWCVQGIGRYDQTANGKKSEGREDETKMDRSGLKEKSIQDNQSDNDLIDFALCHTVLYSKRKKENRRLRITSRV